MEDLADNTRQTLEEEDKEEGDDKEEEQKYDATSNTWWISELVCSLQGSVKANKRREHQEINKTSLIN